MCGSAKITVCGHQRKWSKAFNLAAEGASVGTRLHLTRPVTFALLPTGSWSDPFRQEPGLSTLFPGPSCKSQEDSLRARARAPTAAANEVGLAEGLPDAASVLYVC